MADFNPSASFAFVFFIAAVAAVTIVEHIANAAAAIFGPRVSADGKLLAALKRLSEIRPTNWDDEEDPDQAAAWAAADEAIAYAEDRS